MPNEEMWTEIAEKQGTDLAGFKANMVKAGFVASIKDFANTLHELDATKLETLGKSENIPISKISFQAENYQTVVDRACGALTEIVEKTKKVSLVFW